MSLMIAEFQYWVLVARFWWREPAGVAIMRRGQGLFRASSTVDPAQGAEPSSEGCGASAKTRLRKGKSLHGSVRTEAKSGRNYPANTKVREERRDMVLQVSEQRGDNFNLVE